jgi:hypothetical protein
MASSCGYEQEQINKVIDPLGEIEVTLVNHAEWQGISSYKICVFQYPDHLVKVQVSWTIQILGS